MNQDEALQKWIEEDMCNVPCAMPVDEAGEYMCREAWFAAVKHTLEHVTSELRKKSHECSERRARWYSDLADLIARMKP